MDSVKLFEKELSNFASDKLFHNELIMNLHCKDEQESVDISLVHNIYQTMSMIITMISIK